MTLTQFLKQGAVKSVQNLEVVKKKVKKVNNSLVLKKKLAKTIKEGSENLKLQKYKMNKLKKHIKKKQNKLLRRNLIISPAAQKIKKARIEKLKNLKRNTREVKSCQPTPTMSFKKIPKALHNTEVPLDSKCFQNTQIGSDNPQLVDKLSKDIFKYMRSIETLYQPRANYIERNQNLNLRKRAKQVDYLLRLSHEMMLKRQTFYLAISMLDRFFELVKVRDDEHYDLIALTSLFTAAKYEEMTFPTVNDFVYLGKNRFTKAKFLETEIIMLETLGWRLNHVSPMSFLDQVAKGLNLQPKTYFFAQLLIELMIYKGEALKYKNSMLGTATLFVALNLFEKESFQSQSSDIYSKLIKMSLCDRFKLQESCQQIFKFTKNVFKKEEEVESAVFCKFKKGYYAEVSKIIATVNDPDFNF